MPRHGAWERQPSCLLIRSGTGGGGCPGQVVSQLHLKPSFVDRAARLFRTAVERNFVQGRKTMCVVAVCLYMVCREESSPHMLLDFSGTQGGPHSQAGGWQGHVSHRACRVGSVMGVFDFAKADWTWLSELS